MVDFDPQQILGSFSASPVPAIVKAKQLVPAVINQRGSHPN